jgi:hypothetical protein
MTLVAFLHRILSACSEPGAQGIIAAAEESADAATDPHRAQAEVMTSVQIKNSLLERFCIPRIS